MDAFKRATHCGPGGRKCVCCGPESGSKHKDQKLARVRLKRRLREELQEMEDDFWADMEELAAYDDFGLYDA